MFCSFLSLKNWRASAPVICQSAICKICKQNICNYAHFLIFFSNLVLCIQIHMNWLCDVRRCVASLCEKKTKRLLWSNDYFGAVHKQQTRKCLITFLVFFLVLAGWKVTGAPAFYFFQPIKMNKTEKVTFHS